MKLLKYLGIGLVAVVVLVVAAVAAVVVFVDPNQFKPEIAEAVREQTGREITLQGDLRLSLFPWLGLKIGSTRLANAEGFGAGPFAELEELDIKVRIAPLVEQRVEADVVTIKGLKLHLQREADGRANWDDLVRSPNQPSKPGGRGEGGNAKKPKPEVAAFAIGGVRIIDAELIWEDRQAATQFALRQVNLVTGPVSPTEPVSFESTLELESASSGIAGSAELQGLARLDLADEKVELSDGKVSADLSGVALGGGALSADLDFSSRFDLNDQALDLKVPALTFRFSGGPLADGRLQGQSNFSAQFEPGGRQVRVSDAKLALGFEDGALGQGSARSVFEFDAIADLVGNTLVFEPSRLNFDLEGGPMADGKVVGTLDFAADVDLARQLASLRGGSLDLSAEGGPLQDGSLVAGGDFEAEIDVTQQSVSFPESSLQMVLSGGTWGEGSASGRLQTAALLDWANRRVRLTSGRLRFDAKDGPLHGATSKGSLEFAALGADLDGYGVDLGQSVLDLDMSGGPLGAEGSLKADANFSASGNLVDGVVRVPQSAVDLRVTSRELLGGELDARLDFSAEADLEQRRYTLGQSKLSGNLTGPDLPEGGLPTALAFSGTLDLTTQKLTVPRLEGRFLDVPLSADLVIDDIEDDARFLGSITTQRFNPRSLMSAFGIPDPKTADPKVLRRAALETSFDGGHSELDLKGMKLVLDDSTVTGTLSVADSASTKARFDLNIDRIDLDRYLVESPAGDDGGEAPAAVDKQKKGDGGAGKKGLGLPIGTLRSLDLEGRVRVGRFKSNNLRTRDLDLQASARDGLIAVEPFSLKAYQGAAEGAVGLDVRGKVPQLTARLNLTGVAIEPLLKDLSGDASLSGKGDAKMDLKASGRSEKALLRSLQGTAAVEFHDGTIKGINIAQSIRAAKAAVEGRRTPKDGKNETDFAELSGTARIHQGVVRNEDLYVKSPLLRITGKGDVDLPAETLDYLASATIVGTLQGQGGRDLADLEGVTLPVRAKGPLSNPKYEVDLEALIAAYARRRAESEIKKALGVPVPEEAPVTETKKKRKNKKNNKKQKQEQATSAGSPEELGLELLRGILEKK